MTKEQRKKDSGVLKGKRREPFDKGNVSNAPKEVKQKKMSVHFGNTEHHW